MKYFEKAEVKASVVNIYLRVLNAADNMLDLDFKKVVKANGVFLQKSDLVYGISGGRLLENFDKDDTLSDTKDIESCLKIYKRILLTINKEIVNLWTSNKIEDLVSRNVFENGIELSDFGEVTLETIRKNISRIEESRRLPSIISTLNESLAEIFSMIYNTDAMIFEVALKKLEKVLTLNREKAETLGIYHTLLGKMATKIPKSMVYQLYSIWRIWLTKEQKN